MQKAANETIRFADGKKIEAVYGLKKTTRFALIKEGKIRAKKVGASTLIECASVDEFLAAQPDACGRQAA
jgi:excisionase family DNA binding protein